MKCNAEDIWTKRVNRKRWARSPFKTSKREKVRLHKYRSTVPLRSMDTITKHIEANHITGMSIPCDTCGKAFGSRDSMKSHRYVNHRKGK